MLNPLTVWITTNRGKFLDMGIPDHLICLLRNLYAGQEATVRTGHGTKDWERSSKLGKEYIKGVYRHPNYLTYIQSISCEMPGWINHKLEQNEVYEENMFCFLLFKPSKTGSKALWIILEAPLITQDKDRLSLSFPSK